MIITFFRTKIGKASIIALVIAMIIALFITTVSVKDKAIMQKEIELQQKQEDINRFQLGNETLQKELEFIKENEKFKNNFTNSKVSYIEKELLTRKEHEAFNYISNSFYNYFSILSKSSKIYKNAIVKTARNILYKDYYKQTRFNEKLSRCYYQNRTMAIMV